MNTAPNIVMIGVSTGGPVALRQLFRDLPPINAAIVVVLHIPPGMDYKISRGVGSVASMPFTLATDGEYIQPQTIYMAPGGFHLKLAGNSRIVLQEGPRVNFVQPSADVAMKSLLRPLNEKLIVGIILTGMGKDGAEGIRHVKSIGGITMAQDRASSAIYGMPKAAVATGAVDFELSLESMVKKLRELLGERGR